MFPVRPPASVVLRRPPVARTLAIMRGLVLTGSTRPTALAWAADAARTLGPTGSHDKLATARVLAKWVRDEVAFVDDPYGDELIQPLEQTLTRRAGDCDDFAVAFLSLARAAGLRGGLAVLERTGPDGPVVLHVLPILEDPSKAGSWLPVELTRPVAFGVWPAVEGTWRRFPIEAPTDGTAGFLELLPALAGSVLSFVNAGKDREAQLSLARDATRAADTTERRQARAADMALNAGTIERERAAYRAQLATATASENFSRVLDLVKSRLPVVLLAIAAMKWIGAHR